MKNEPCVIMLLIDEGKHAQYERVLSQVMAFALQRPEIGVQGIQELGKVPSKIFIDAPIMTGELLSLLERIKDEECVPWVSRGAARPEDGKERAVRIERAQWEEIEFEKGSGNIFADLGLEDANELFERSRIVKAICNLVKGKAASEVADLLDIAQSQAHHLLNGHVQHFTRETLNDWLKRLS